MIRFFDSFIVVANSVFTMVGFADYNHAAWLCRVAAIILL